MRKTLIQEKTEESRQENVPMLSADTLDVESLAKQNNGACIHRDVTKVNIFEDEYRLSPETKPTLFYKGRQGAALLCTKSFWRSTLLKNFPFLSTLGKYRLFQDFPSDVIAGLTSGVMMIPQSMAFATLASLPPVVGLYVAFFASLTYFFLGTAHQVSWGNVAVLTVLAGSIIDKTEIIIPNNKETENSSTAINVLFDPGNLTASTFWPLAELSTYLLDYDENGVLNSSGLSISHAEEMTFNRTSGYNVHTQGDIDRLTMDKRLERARSMTFVGGLILILLSKLGLKKVNALISKFLISGFTVGIYTHIFAFQVKHLLGLPVPDFSGMFALIKTCTAIFSTIHLSNPATAIISAVSIIVIYLVDKFVNERFTKRLRVPIPVELLVLIIGTIVSSCLHVNARYGTKVIKDMPVGIPNPGIPNLSYGGEFFLNVNMMMMVTYTICISSARSMGILHNYKVRTNQELFACGMCNLVSSIFSGYITGISMSRTLAQDRAGGRTQVASLFAAALVLMVIMILGPYLYHLPKCILAAIIILSLRPALQEVRKLPDRWRKSRPDATVWFLTCVCTTFLDLQTGFIIGILASIVTVLKRFEKGVVDLTARIHVGDKTRVWRSKDKYHTVEENSDTKILRLNCPLYFANFDIVMDEIFKKTRVDPIKLKRLKSLSPDGGSDTSETCMKNHCQLHEINNQTDSQPPVVLHTAPFSNLIIDMSGATFLDLCGVQALEHLLSEFRSVDISVYIANISDNCLKTLKKTGFMDTHCEWMFVTLDNAVDSIVQSQNETKSV